MKKTCIKCWKTLSYISFYKHKGYSDGYTPYCIKCTKNIKRYEKKINQYLFFVQCVNTKNNRNVKLGEIYKVVSKKYLKIHKIYQYQLSNGKWFDSDKFIILNSN